MNIQKYVNFKQLKPWDSKNKTISIEFFVVVALMISVAAIVIGH